MEKIARVASGYIYYVSLKGVTGASHLDLEEVAPQASADPLAHRVARSV